MAIQIIEIQGGTVLTASKNLDGLDTVVWKAEPGVIGKKGYIRAESTALGFNIAGNPGENFLRYDLNYTGTKGSKGYRLYLEGNGSSVEVFGPSSQVLDLVVDTIGGMMTGGYDDDRGVGNQQGYHEGAG